MELEYLTISSTQPDFTYLVYSIYRKWRQERRQDYEQWIDEMLPEWRLKLPPRFWTTTRSKIITSPKIWIRKFQPSISGLSWLHLCTKKGRLREADSKTYEEVILRMSCTNCGLCGGRVPEFYYNKGMKF